MNTDAEVLDLFLPPVAEWFRRRMGRPTPVQREGWPAIAAGQNTLLLAPTGSGKTLAAFLACLDGLWRQNPIARGVQVLYVSPLKALNNDIHRNLQIPLHGVAAIADEMGDALPRIDIAIRTGDTPAAERQRLLRQPPHVLITTPESLHLLLTSKARESLRHVTHCIIDEIHALCPNKRGVFLALLLERLQHLNERAFVRIGLSATQRPLEEVARYLGGFSYDHDEAWRPRPATIVDTGLRKNLDLQVVSPVEQFMALPEKSIWPAIYRRLADEIRQHRSTIVFANNRRTVERLTAHLNEYLYDQSIDERALDETLSQAGASGTSPAREAAARQGDVLVRAHHGSVALEVRRQTEQSLKEGRLRAVVATASLELGIDMGAVDLVCQIESTGNVARALQRVGRAGHLVGQSSKGRLIAKTLPDLLNQAVLAREMAAGRVEALQVPMNCLDVLAQQVIAMTAMDDWNVADLYRLIRQAYPYRDLTAAAMDAVLEMVSGRYRLEPAPVAESASENKISTAQRLAALQPRISWDRVHQRLHALPGSQRLALVHGGTIPDTGQYAVYTAKGLRLGEVDEEFVYERRVGDTFLLGTNAWRIDRIETDRVLVHAAEGTPALVPFWRGESTGRSYDLGLAQGAFLRELAERLEQVDCNDWLQHDYFLDSAAASNLRFFVQRQLRRTNCVPTDRTLVIEATRDPLGDWQVILLSPFGRAVNLGLRLAIEHRLHARLGYRPQCMHHDDGIMIRLTESDEPVLDLLDGITVENVRDMILEELADSALFALRFRQNAARALMMPRGSAGKRAPLWLQRLRGRDLLQVARRYPDFPIVAETFRECLHDHLDLPHLLQLLNHIENGQVCIETRRLDTPSPFAAALLFAFTMAYMYQYDDVEATGASSAPLDQGLLDQLIGHEGRPLPLDPRAVQKVDRRLRDVGLAPRSKAETAEWLRKLGDVAEAEIDAGARAFLDELEKDGVVIRLKSFTPPRWILTEEQELYANAFSSDVADAGAAREAASTILQRFLTTHALIGLDDVLARYPFERSWAQTQLEEWTRQGRLIRVETQVAEPLQWSAPENFDQMQRSTLSILRREVMTCPPELFADFVLRWQYAHSAARVENADGLGQTLERLRGFSAPLDLWEHAILPARVKGYSGRLLNDWMSQGRWTWYCRQESPGNETSLAFLERESISQLPPVPIDGLELDARTAAIVEALRQRGAMFTSEIASLTAISESAARASLWTLLRGGVVTNDQLDIIRKGEPARLDEAPLMRSRGELRSFLRDSRRKSNHALSEGRWSLLPWAQPDAETEAFFQATLLLERYGVVSRELALLSGTPTPWRILYEVLSRMEMAGEVRRGYFVEGLSGAQFALPDAAKLLQEIALPSQTQAPVVLIHSLDPANLYGTGAAFELTIADGELRTFQRRPGNWVALKAGRPIFLIEQHGKRLTALPHASVDDLRQATSRLPDLLKWSNAGDARHKLTVETWNDQAVTSTAGKELLEQAGFVRDYLSMTLYAVWSG